MISAAKRAGRSGMAVCLGGNVASLAHPFASSTPLQSERRSAKVELSLDIDFVLDDCQIDLVEGVDLVLRLGVLQGSSATARRIATGRCSVVAAPAYLARVSVHRTPHSHGQAEVIR